MNKFKKILLATNGTDAAKAAEDSALWLALRDGAEVIITDTIRMQGRVEKWFVHNSEAMYGLLKQEKQERLDKLAEEFVDKGVRKVSSILLTGKSSLQLTREVMRHQCDLLVRYRKGSDSRRPGVFGNTALNLLRVCPCPVLLVHENQPIESPSILACVDIHDEEVVNTQIINAARRIAGGAAGNVGVLYCWTIFGHDMIRRRMEQHHYEKMVEDIKHEHEEEFERFLDKFKISKSLPNVAIEFGDPEFVVAPFVDKHQVDVTVMSTITPTGFASRLLGSTIENVLAELPTNLLAVKPTGFVSPVHSDEDASEGVVAFST